MLKLSNKYEGDLHGKGEASASQNPRDQGGRDEGQVLPGVLKGGLVNLGLRDPLGLGPSVLEPDLHLGLGQIKLSSEVRSLGDGEVALLVEFLFQLVELLVGEGSPGLPVRLVFPQSALERERWTATADLLVLVLVLLAVVSLELGKLLLLLELLQEEQLGHPGEHGGGGGGGHHQGHGGMGHEGWGRDGVRPVADWTDAA